MLPEHAKLVHTHTFREERVGTTIIDSVEFDVPFAWLTSFFVVRDVERIFAYRQRALPSLVRQQ